MKRKRGDVHPSIALEKVENTRTGSTVAAIKQAILDNLHCVQGRVPELASRNDWYMAVAFTVRDRFIREYCDNIWKTKPVK